MINGIGEASHYLISIKYKSTEWYITRRYRLFIDYVSNKRRAFSTAVIICRVLSRSVPTFLRISLHIINLSAICRNWLLRTASDEKVRRSTPRWISSVRFGVRAISRKFMTERWREFSGMRASSRHIFPFLRVFLSREEVIEKLLATDQHSQMHNWYPSG